MPSLIRNKVSGGKTLMKHVTPTLSKFVIGNQEISFNTRVISLHFLENSIVCGQLTTADR